SPEFGAEHADVGEWRRHRDLAVLHLLDAAGGEAESALRHLQKGFADAAIGIVDIAVDHDARMLAEGKLSFVEELNLKPRIGSGVQLVFICTGVPMVAVTAPEAEITCASFSTLLTTP